MLCYMFSTSNRIIEKFGGIVIHQAINQFDWNIYQVDLEKKIGTLLNDIKPDILIVTGHDNYKIVEKYCLVEFHDIDKNALTLYNKYRSSTKKGDDFMIITFLGHSSLYNCGNLCYNTPDNEDV